VEVSEDPDKSDESVIVEAETEATPDDASAYIATQTSSESEQVEEVDGQGFSYSTSNELEGIMTDSDTIILDDLPIDSLVVENKQSLSVEQAQELIPKEALKTLTAT
jgi:hypothetical protein